MPTAVEIAQRYIEHTYAGRIADASALLTDNVQLVMGGGGAMVGLYEGRDAYFAAFGRMMSLTNGTYRTVGDTRWVDGGDMAIAFAKEQVTRNGTIIELDRVITFELHGALIRRVRVYEGDPAAADSAFAA